MSQVDNDQERDGPHEGPIRTPKQLIVAVLFAFVVPIVVIVLLAVYVEADPRPAAGSDSLAAPAVDQRLRPVGLVEVKDLNDPAAMKSGDQVYAAQCAACHTTGAAGAPKLGDAAAWAPRLASGYEALLKSALHGKGAMGPQGGGDFSDFEIGRAVVYLANQGGGSLPEPKFAAPAATDATQAAADPAAASAVAAATAAMAHVAAPAATTTAGAGATAGAAAPAVYTQACAVCHAAGVAGAPKLGDKAAWAPRVKQGKDVLHAAALKGKGAMPPKGGNIALGDDAVKAAVDYMLAAAR